MFLIDLVNLSSKKTSNLIQERANANHIQPELVSTSNVNGSIHYKRLRDFDKKEQFRNDLLLGLRNKWAELFGAEKSLALETYFKELAHSLDENGATIFGEIISKNSFTELIEHYNSILNNHGSKSWIHSYVNLGNHPEFLSHVNFNDAFLHPLLIALISFRVGGPIRLVDARGKDANPITVLAQDNMLHIDNTPFADEYKIILTWEKNKPSGPKGQNFVFIPGTQKGVRNSFCNKHDNSIWSTENASIFISNQSIQQIFDFQKEVLPDLSPMVVEAHHDEKPLTIVFAAGSLVHHRYRTDEGLARSCVILAFHRAVDNKGQFVSPEHLDKVKSEKKRLNNFLFGYHESGSEKKFIDALADEAQEISIIMKKLSNDCEDTIIVEQSKIKLTPIELESWKSIVTNAPTVEQLKIEKLKVPLEKEINHEEMFNLVTEMMMFDKHGPLDLILYSDNHEEIRKWTRNQIREMKISTLKKLLRNWLHSIEQPTENHLLTPQDLKDISNNLANMAEQEIKNGTKAVLDPIEKISTQDAFKSVKQAIIDFGESVMRCESRQAFLSTCLFIFWTCDLLNRIKLEKCEKIEKIGHKLLMNYIATGILIAKKINEEQREI